MTIFEMLAQQKAHFPTTVSEYVALQLAHRLSDQESAGWYRQIAERHPLAYLLGLYKEAISAGPSGAKERFRLLLKQ